MQLALSLLVYRNVARIADQSTSFSRALMQTIGHWYRGLEDGWLMYLRYEALARLSDHGLARRGLARGDISQAALRYVEQHQR